MQIGIKINPTEFALGLLTALSTELNRGLNQAAPLIKNDIKLLIAELLEDTNTYKSLLSGELRYEFGLRSPTNLLPAIIEILQRSVNVSVQSIRSIGYNLYGGITISFIRSDFSDILSSSSASYESKTFTVKWLEWLLTAGDTIIIADYHIQYNLQPHQKIKSRTGVAIMEEGGAWRVPPAYAGTITNNWITQTFEVPSVQDRIAKIIEKNVKSV